MISSRDCSNVLFREGVDYNGGRDLEALVKFVESGGTEGNEAGDDDEDVS